MAGRGRRSSTKILRSQATDDTAPVVGDDVAARVAAVEHLCKEMKHGLDVQFQRIAAMQAQLDHLAAKISGR